LAMAQKIVVVSSAIQICHTKLVFVTNRVEVDREKERQRDREREKGDRERERKS